MSNINLSIPLDEEHFFRRECPFCHKEFKILLEQKELTNFIQKSIDSFMIEAKKEADLNINEKIDVEFVCPYCGQKAFENAWWTQEQIVYMKIAVQNIMKNIINEQLIRHLKTSEKYNSGLISMQFKGEELKHQEIWISPENNDMTIFYLPCCERKIKIEDNWKKQVYCFFCSFPHNGFFSPTL